jgi:hypothetical protein
MLQPKLGLIGPKADRLGRTLKLVDFLRPGFAVPYNCDTAFGLAPDTDPLGNLDVGDCAVAGPGHFERWEDLCCGRPMSADESGILHDYSAIGGYVPGDPETDGGCFAIDVMNYWRKTGICGRKIDAFATVDHYDREQVQMASFLLGGAFLCLSLPRLVASGDMFEADTWDVAGDDGGHAGNHLVLLQGDCCNTWGRRVRVTPAFISRYCFEAWGVVSKHGLRDGRAYSGLDLVAMGQALAAVTG